MRVLHAPTDVGGNPWGLSRAERKLGIESDMMVFKSQWFGYPSDINLHFESVPPLIKGFKRWKFLKSAIKEYDVLNFNFGRSILDYPFSGILNYLDLPALKKAGKKIVMTFQGCDARIKGYCTRNFEISACAECNMWYCNFVLDRMKKRRLQKLLRYADKVYVLNPDLIHVCPSAEFLPYSCINPYDWIPSHKTKNDETIRILHVPTNRGIKGTKYVIDAYERLKKEGYSVELLLLENTPHDKIKEFYEQSDIVIDQLLVGWYGAVAVEAMALEKPVLCYLRDEDFDFLYFKNKIPILNTTPQSLYEDLIELIEDPYMIRKKGEQGRKYVEEIHNPVKIAKKLIRMYEE